MKQNARILSQPKNANPPLNCYFLSTAFTEKEEDFEGFAIWGNFQFCFCYVDSLMYHHISFMLYEQLSLSQSNWLWPFAIPLAYQS